jgi:hypothetical protein
MSRVQTEVLMNIFMVGNATGVTETLNNKQIYRASKLRSMCENYFYLLVNVTMMGE